MNNNCIFLKQKLNRKVVCKLDESKVVPMDCANCPLKKINCTIYSKNCANNHQIKKSPVRGGLSKRKPDSMKKKSNKLAKLERNRESLFTDNMDKCYFCNKKKDHIHEVIFGKNRANSMKYGLTLPLCSEHHKLMHEDTTLIEEYKKRGQLLFKKNYPNLNFEDIFKRNYL